MKRVAKLILIDKDHEYLMLYRADHPAFPNDPDLPGGVIEPHEEPAHGLIRELLEETHIVLGAAALEKLYESKAYDKDYVYYLYRAKLDSHPEVALSWEHSRYEWLPRPHFITEAHTATDAYMHMVYDYLT